MAIITISRGTMSGGESLAKVLSARLNYPTLGRELLVEAAATIGVPEDTLRQRFEKSPNLWARLTTNRKLYVAAVQASLAEHAVTGNLVYHGNAGHLLLKGVPTVLRVRLIAPMEQRVRTVMERQKMTDAAATEYIHSVDEDRVRWTRLLYGVDWSDPSLYDLVFNLEFLSVPAIGAMIALAVEQPAFAPGASVKKALADFALSCRVRVALATNPQTQSVDFDIRANDGAVDLRGELPEAGLLANTSARDRDEVLRTARSVPGVKNVVLHTSSFGDDS